MREVGKVSLRVGSDNDKNIISTDVSSEGFLAAFDNQTKLEGASFRIEREDGYKNSRFILELRSFDIQDKVNPTTSKLKKGIAEIDLKLFASLFIHALNSGEILLSDKQLRDLVIALGNSAKSTDAEFKGG